MIHSTTPTMTTADWSAKSSLPPTTLPRLPEFNERQILPGHELSDAGKPTSNSNDDPTRKAFTDFVGQTLFGQLLQSMRSTQGKPAYFHGGRGEEVFQQQLDQVLVEEISEASASSVADPMYELFRLQRSQ